ncbi:MAG TPA: helix-turn-helix domain-containing protein [Polyangiaceae bacterium]|jgi:transcriptional regulator with XRE-family HTH domain
MTTTFGERLALARGFSGLSASALGVKVGLSSAIVSMIEAGKRDNPNLKTITSIAEILGLDILWWITGTGTAPTEETVLAAVKAHDNRMAKALRKARRKGAAA